MFKFALHNYAGKPVQYVVVHDEALSTQGSSSTPASHHIAILDVSGSMWGDLASVKSVVEKVFTAEEFNDPGMKVSLLSYASNGDCRVHFERVTVAEVMAPNSPHLREIRNLRTRGLTGISQALVAAEKLINDGEATCISLHTDGYANHPSPFQEARAVSAAVEAIGKHPNVFCNTVAYRNWCDFQMLDAIANRLSGTCVRVSNARQVYDALHSTQAMLAGNVTPAIDVPANNADFVAFVSLKGKKCIGASSDLSVRGLSDGDDATVYRYTMVDEAAYNASTAPVADNAYGGMTPILAYCRSQLALGNLNNAKYAMVSTRIGNLIQAHARAMVPSEVAAMADDVEGFMWGGLTMMGQADYGLGDTGPSVLSVLQVLNQYRSSLRLNVADLSKGYQRRGLKRLAGKRDDDGNLVSAAYKLQTPRDRTAMAVSGIDINRDTATANIRVASKGTLIDTATGAVVHEQAEKESGITLDLQDYKNYTVVGDGQVNVQVLPVRMSDKRCFAALKKLGVVDGTFDPTKQYDLDIGSLPLVDYDQDFQSVPGDMYDNLVKVTVLQKILAGLTKGESLALTGDQIAVLKKYLISPSLYFNPPTTTPYTDLGEALNKGEVDTRVSYKVKVGSPDIIHLGKLKSGNAYLQRRFDLTLADGSVHKKPTLDMWWDDTVTWGVKALSSRTKLDAVDEVSYPIYQGFLCLGPDTALREALDIAGADTDAVFDAINGGCDRDEAVEVFKSALSAINATIDRIYDEHISPLAFYVGSTGLVPDSLATTAMTAEQLVDKFPGCKLGKAEKEGTYYEIAPSILLGVFTKAEHFSTERGVKVASEVQAAAK